MGVRSVVNSLRLREGEVSWNGQEEKEEKKVWMRCQAWGLFFVSG